MCALDRAHGVPGAVVNDNLILANQLLPVFPAPDILKGVAPHDDRKALQRKLLLQVRQGVDGVRRLGQRELHIRRSELRVVADGELHQVEPVIFVEQRMGFLQRVVWRQYKPDLIYLRVLQHMVRDDQVAGMDWIKGAEIKTYVHFV